MRLPASLMIIGLCLQLGGCVSTPNITLTYVPDPIRRSPLETLKPLAVSIVVEDYRDTFEQDRVGNRRDGLGSVRAPVHSKEDITLMVREALKKEFQNNGLQVTEAGAARKAIVARLRKCWVENAFNVIGVTFSSSISADVQIEDPAEKGKVSSHAISGTAQDRRQLATESAFEEVMNLALAEFVQNFARDPGVLSSLRHPK